jgi:hypothetical protein
VITTDVALKLSFSKIDARASDFPGSRTKHCPSDKTPKNTPPVLPDESSAARKINLFPKGGIYDLTKQSRPHEGRFAIVTIRGAGCDGRRSAQAMRANAYGQAVWS